MENGQSVVDLYTSMKNMVMFHMSNFPSRVVLKNEIFIDFP
jgi:hypothetical protein